MTGMYEQTRPGMGHNQPDEYAEEKKHQKWERWAKKRTFVRALEGTYSHLYKALLEEKRVYPSNEVPWKGGPGQFGKSVISPQATTIIQSIESHIEAYAPAPSGRSTAISTARCSTCSRATATTCMTAATSSGRPAT